MGDQATHRRTYRYRIYPTVRQRLALEAQLRFACELYNAALEQRRDAWRRQRRSLNYVKQCRDLTDVRAAGLGPIQMNCTAMRDPRHERIRNVRNDHAHKLSRQLVKEFGTIAIEKLNIRALSSGFLAREVTDQAWAAFLKVLEYKAAEAGTELIKVPPKGTSQACSGCGAKVPKRLSERIHNCPTCRLVIDRDTNAARNILRLGMSHQAPTWPTGACVA